MLKLKLPKLQRLPVLFTPGRPSIVAFVFINVLINVLFFQPTVVSAATADEKTGRSRQESETEAKKPVVITAKTMDADNLANKALFVGDVVAKSDGVTVYADRMEVFYSEDSGQIIRIEYEGSVRMIKDKRSIVAERATYYGDEEKIDFRGDPRILEGDNLVTGSKIFYYPSKDRLVVKDSRVYMHNK